MLEGLVLSLIIVAPLLVGIFISALGKLARIADALEKIANKDDDVLAKGVDYESHG